MYSMVIVISGINEQENFPSDNQQHCHHESYRFKTHTKNIKIFEFKKKIEWIIIKFVFVFISNFHMNWNEMKMKRFIDFKQKAKNDYLYNSFEFAFAGKCLNSKIFSIVFVTYELEASLCWFFSWFFLW